MYSSIIITILIILNLHHAESASLPKQYDFELSVIHMNDFHDRYEEIDPSGSACKSTTNCIGGFSRLFTAVKQLASNNPNSIILNAGDNFQGTHWYTFYKWNVTQHFFNLLPVDVYTLGNHEFDDGIGGVLPFVKAIKAPVVITNVDASKEPLFERAIKRSVVLERNGKRIGVIGVIGTDTKDISHPGNLQILDEIESINNEADRMTTEDNVDIIIVLSHCGLKLDKLIAQRASAKIGLIVGGHSHTLLHTGEMLPGPDKRYGTYPIIVYREHGRKVLVVQASAYSKYGGHIFIRFDKNGNVVSWNGNTIYLNGSIPQDPYVNEEVAKWKKELDSVSSKIVGSTLVELTHKTCRFSECALGNFVADAMIFEQTNASIAIVAAEGFRASIQKGNITYGDLSLAVPFQNTYDTLELQGEYLKELLEYAAGTQEKPESYKSNLKSVSGLRVTYNVTKSVGSRVVQLQVYSRSNAIYQDIEMDKIYGLVVDSYTVDRSDGNPVLVEHMLNRKIGNTDTEVLVKYVEANSPINPVVEGRIVITS